MNFGSLNQNKRSNKTTGVTGVVYYKEINKYRVCIGVDQESKHVGDFNTFEEAVSARKEAEKLSGYREVMEYKRPKTNKGNTSHSKKTKLAFNKLRTNYNA